MQRRIGKSTVRLAGVLLLLAASTVITGCKLQIIVPPGGHVVSESGNISCGAGESCTIDITDVFFDETFQAIPDPGYTFVSWRQRLLGWCGGRNAPCRLTTTGLLDTPFMSMLEDDYLFYLQPIFAVPNTWTRRADLPHPGVGVASCVIDGRLYVVGAGADSSGNGKPEHIDEYDPVTNTWRGRAVMPVARNFVTASAVGGKCYVIGGEMYPGGEATNLVQAYDPLTNTWQEKAPLPESRAGAGSAEVNGKIYVIGGGDRAGAGGSSARAAVAIYEPAKNQWRSGANMQVPRAGVGVTALGDAIVAVGGYSFDGWVDFASTLPYPAGTTDVVELYSTTADQWQGLENLPISLQHTALTAYHGERYAFGGVTGDSSVAGEVYHYNAHGRGDSPTGLPTPRWGHTSALLDGQIYLVGGSGTTGTGAALALTQMYTPEPPFPPTPALAFDCNSPTPAAGSTTDAPTAGYYSGTLYNCAQGGGASDVTAWVDEEGRFRIFPSGGGGQLFTGSLQIDGDRFQGTGLNFAEQGYRYFSGGATRLWMDGLIAEGQSDFDGFSLGGGRNLEGRWGSEWGDYGYFTLGQYKSPPPEPTSWVSVAGIWSGLREGFNPPFSGRYDWVIDTDGRLSGHDPTGCAYTGQLTLLDARYVIYELDLTITGCPLAGTYSGIANKSGGPFNDVLHVAVDDGSQHALSLYLLLDL